MEKNILFRVFDFSYCYCYLISDVPPPAHHLLIAPSLARQSFSRPTIARHIYLVRTNTRTRSYPYTNITLSKEKKALSRSLYVQEAGK